MESRSKSDKLGYLTENITKQSVECAAWFLLTAFSKIREEGDKLKKMLRKKELKSEDLENSIRIIKKMRKQVLERTPRVWLENNLIKRLWVLVIDLISYHSRS